MSSLQKIFRDSTASVPSTKAHGTGQTALSRSINLDYGRRLYGWVLSNELVQRRLSQDYRLDAKRISQGVQIEWQQASHLAVFAQGLLVVHWARKRAGEDAFFARSLGSRAARICQAVKCSVARSWTITTACLCWAGIVNRSKLRVARTKPCHAHWSHYEWAVIRPKLPNNARGEFLA